MLGKSFRLFTEIAQFNNWPGSDVYNLCRLRVMEEQALLELQNAQPFSLPPNGVGFGSAGLPTGFRGDPIIAISRITRLSQSR